MTDIEIAEENKDNNENIDTQEVEEPKKRRRRRTKAQIEADKAAESSEEKHEQDVENGVDASAVTEENESDSFDETEQEAVAEPETSIVEDQNDHVEADSEDCTHEHVCECADGCEGESCSCVKDGSKVFGTLRVYDKPSDSSTWKILTCVYEKVGEFGSFFQVQRMRQGFGIVNCYVKKSDFAKIFNR